MFTRLSEEQVQAFHDNGFVLAPDVYDTSTIQAAYHASDILMYGMPYEEFRARFHYDDGAFAATLNGADLEPKKAKFPTGVREVDRLLEHEGLLNAFQQCLETESIRYCNAHLFARTGIIDTRHKPNPWEGYHIDHDTDSFLPPTIDWMQYAYVNCHVFLNDVGLDTAPMHLIPRSHQDVARNFPAYLRQAILIDRGNIGDIRNLPQLTEREAATAKAGSVLFYSSYLIHAAVPFLDKRAQRALFTATMVRADNASWKRTSWPYAFTERRAANEFLAHTTARMRTVLGWPVPGHSYYTEATLELLEFWFPGIDLDPYRKS